MNRIDRLSAIMTHLQSKKIVKAEDIARRFEISLRTVYRDIRALSEAGIPISGEAGMGYTIMEGYRLPPVMFTREEAMALLVAEKIVTTLTDHHNSQQIESAMFKIKSVLRSSEKEALEDLNENIAIRSPRNNSFKDTDQNILQSLLTGITDQQVIHLKYSTILKQEISERNVEPVGVYYSNEHWYLIAYCQLRQAYRTFRLDRIRTIRTTTRSFEQRHPSLKSFLEKIRKKERLIKVVMQIDKSIVHYLREEKYRQGFVMEEEKEDLVEMTFMVSGIYGIARWFMKMADHAVIIEPSHLIDHVLMMTEKMLARQKKANSS
ncbi:MAG: YafY family transcriptional regulator [Saprospiraceae bacterium]|nr:YafY family transcriptional regulator [Saprospiraceae bacterium]